MTRINVGIKPRHLTDEHLLAEHREIKRVPNLIEKSIKSGSINKVPNEFTLGKGHVIFFLNKIKYLHIRYTQIHEECIRRKLNVSDYSSNFTNVPDDYYNDYNPTQEDKEKILSRIMEKISNSPKKNFHYYSRKITKKDAIKLLHCQ